MSTFRMSHTSFNSSGLRNSLAVQWLELGAFTARAEFNPWLGNYDPISCVFDWPKKKKKMSNGLDHDDEAF